MRSCNRIPSFWWKGCIGDRASQTNPNSKIDWQNWLIVWISTRQDRITTDQRIGNLFHSLRFVFIIPSDWIHHKICLLRRYISRFSISFSCFLESFSHKITQNWALFYPVTSFSKLTSFKNLNLNLLIVWQFDLIHVISEIFLTDKMLKLMLFRCFWHFNTTDEICLQNNDEMRTKTSDLEIVPIIISFRFHDFAISRLLAWQNRYSNFFRTQTVLQCDQSLCSCQNNTIFKWRSSICRARRGHQKQIFLTVLPQVIPNCESRGHGWKGDSMTTAKKAWKVFTAKRKSEAK
jgi:hypothetical protein